MEGEFSNNWNNLNSDGQAGQFNQAGQNLQPGQFNQAGQNLQAGQISQPEQSGLYGTMGQAGYSQPVYTQPMQQEDYRKPMRKAYCRMEWKILVYAAIATVMQVLYSVGLPALFGDDIVNREWYVWGMMIVPMYMIAFPLFLLIAGNKDRVQIMQHKMGVGKWLIAVLMCAGICGVGAVIGTLIDTVVSLLCNTSSGDTVTLQNLMLGSNPFFRILTVGILAPIVEEMIFRKTIIDRTVKYGEGVAIVTSGIMFGLFHGNFTQCFFAAGLGILFAYIYIRTGRIRYSISLHMAVNLTTSVVSVGVMQWAGFDQIMAMQDDPVALESMMMDILPKILVVYGWIGILCCLALAGVILIIVSLAKKKFYLVKPPKHVAKGGLTAAWINWGMLLFMLYIIFLFVSNYVNFNL